MFILTRKAFISIKPYELFKMIRTNIFITAQDNTICNHTRSRDIYSDVPLLCKCYLNCKNGHLNIKINTSFLDKAQSSLIKWKKTKQESISMAVVNQSSSLLLSITVLLFSIYICRILSTPVYHLKGVCCYLRLRLH